MKLVNYCDKYTEMHGQQNVKICKHQFVVGRGPVPTFGRYVPYQGTSFATPEFCIRILCVCVALGMQHAMCMRHIVCHLWFARLYDIFPHYVTNCTIFGRKKLLNTKCVFLFPYNVYLKYLSF